MTNSKERERLFQKLEMLSKFRAKYVDRIGDFKDTAIRRKLTKRINMIFHVLNHYSKP